MQKGKLLVVSFLMLFSAGCLATASPNRVGDEITLQQYVEFAQLKEDCVTEENKKKGKIADCEDYKTCKKTADYYTNLSFNLRDSAMDVFITTEQAVQLRRKAGQMEVCAEAYLRMTAMMQPKTE